ncbi:Acetyltransferase (GNAT) family protein [Bacillus sp. THAF10]|nr:Acetyltransferase (GNAT) family protein [Bacillus sp. THAF10]
MGIEYNSRLIGYADLANIKDNTAEIGIAIGESKLWGSGIGTKSLEQFMDYAKEILGIYVFEAETHEENIRSKKMLNKLGFVEVSRIGREMYKGSEGQLIQYRFKGGEW